MKPAKYHQSFPPDFQKGDYSVYPFSLATLRFSRQVARRHGCAYVSEVAKLIAEKYGFDQCGDGSAAPFLAYCANCVNDHLNTRKIIREQMRAGFRRVTEPDIENLKGKRALIASAGKRSEPKLCRIIEGSAGPGFILPRKRSSYTPFHFGDFMFNANRHPRVNQIFQR